MTTIVITALFSASDAPATGLTLAQINLYLYARNRATGAITNIWNPQNPTEEIGGGLYSRAYTLADLQVYDYYGYGRYIGATALDNNYSLQNSYMMTIYSPGADVWTYPYRTLTTSIADFHLVQNGIDIEILRGDTLSLSLTYLGNIAARSKLWFTVKEDKDSLDAIADIQIEETGGLLNINKAAAAITANGSIVVTDAAAGNLTITLAAVETAKLDTTGNFMYDLQMMTAAGLVTTLRRGKCKIVGDITRAVT